MDYKTLAKEARLKVLDMIYEAQSSHIGSNFSCIDILTVLYNGILNPDDKVIYSKGWVAASAYYFLAKQGVIPEEDLETYCKEGSPYIGLVEPTVPGIECAGGSMGFGLPFGVGFALAKKMKKEPGKVYVLMGDGEIACGTTWESMLIAVHHKLDNLVVLVDNNGLQAMGKTDDILRVNSSQFSMHFDFDGHNYEDIEEAFKVKNSFDFLVFKTVKGKGVSFMENKVEWHYKAPNKEEYEQAREELGA